MRPRALRFDNLLFTLAAAASIASCQARQPVADIDPNADPAADATQLPRAQSGRVEELLEGRFPGVRVLRRADGGIAVQIRGASSINGGSDPLYVIDGVPQEIQPGGSLMGIDPNDIARIEVLKDIGSISYYGVRGANGVVVITTKGAARKK